MNMDTKQLFIKLIAKENLTQKEAFFLVCQMAEGKIGPTQMAAILILLKSKGETAEEIVGFIEGMRKYMIKVQSSKLKVKNSIDVCGTGGDGKQTFNISTATAFVVAGAGVRVAKHGNRAASSKCGSADVLESLGVNINLNTSQASLVLEKVGMVFLFAQLFHPTMKFIASVRKELGIPTIFNLLGPFLNPASVKRQIIGVPNLSIAKKLARVGKEFGYKHLLLVTSEDGMDEVSISAKTHVLEVQGKKIKSRIVSPADFGVKKASQNKIKGADSKTNAEIILNVLDGKKGQCRDIVILNSALGLYVAGKASSIEQGIEKAQEAIDSGKAKQVLEQLIKETQKYEK
ncbi:MAG: anthranilate phosphoribosyltransferase [Candidatus Levybacteria bacterium RIFCSPHIGHO2_12_FULL_38_12]|nr:MAG: anthranilate phosphoribosyltransferase [Candidatus Levybacteria bacterium RIFCSPHIGHO2_01_FULL_38_12]OGH21779.1 MAG: anthranilate phosphoribosyltransferase [Candidatus Levybacteria bacterium RIFCSPHIGHO2_02_FULL_37_18]OGH22563.1 MAG: anthranilate phosphoribosyltransferase [Candidatus Levybacteria bacterium RIFCSPHIGHO2_12_FULL_38_12]OGH33400.1 MAG: anthranilate phosphoribosyltransferase [Candidatus Levybacteria bacterium RIFCSPLOWO2_01_FULL_37_20]OGH44101.1 MAG: anthranilate phosphoribo